MDSIRIPGAFAPLVSPEQLDALLETSSQRPSRSSNTAGRAARARRPTTNSRRSFRTAAQTQDVYVVDVLGNRQLSQAITARFRVRHESPQVLVIRNAEVRWHGSHFGVTAENVRKALLAALSAIAEPCLDSRRRRNRVATTALS